MSETKTQIDFDGLRMVVEAVRNAPEEKFHMRAWAYVLDCGFAGCAIGWFVHSNPTDTLKIHAAAPSLLRRGITFFGFDAVEQRFGLNALDSRYLFSNFQYTRNMFWSRKVARQEVIARIEKFIADKEGVPCSF